MRAVAADRFSIRVENWLRDLEGSGLRIPTAAVVLDSQNFVKSRSILGGEWDNGEDYDTYSLSYCYYHYCDDDGWCSHSKRK